MSVEGNRELDMSGFADVDNNDVSHKDVFGEKNILDVEKLFELCDLSVSHILVRMEIIYNSISKSYRENKSFNIANFFKLEDPFDGFIKDVDTILVHFEGVDILSDDFSSKRETLKDILEKIEEILKLLKIRSQSSSINYDITVVDKNLERLNNIIFDLD